MTSWPPQAWTPPWQRGSVDAVATSLAAGTGPSGIVVTNDPTTYPDGLYTCDRLQAPATLLSSATQFWFVLRLPSMAYASASVAGTIGGIFEWGDDISNFVTAYFTTTAVGLARKSTAAGQYTQELAHTFSAGDALSLLFRLEDTKVGVSVNGSAITDTSSAPGTAPSLSAGLFDIGRQVTSANRYLDTSAGWSASGTGTVTDADAATLYALGDTPPSYADLPAAANLTAVMPMASTTYYTPPANTVAPAIS